jgi:hypothetical protein
VRKLRKGNESDGGSFGERNKPLGFETTPMDKGIGRF